jgi:hypothetical protein
MRSASAKCSPAALGRLTSPARKGQKLQTAEVTYTNVAVTDTTNGITEPVPGTFSTGCLLPDVRNACS